MGVSIDNTSVETELLSSLLEELLLLKARILSGTKQELTKMNLVETTQENVLSVLNMLNYVVMRREDLYPLQKKLASVGLSSLDRIEPHVMNNLNSMIDILSRAVLSKPYIDDNNEPSILYCDSQSLLKKRVQSMFGKAPKKRVEYIMVTMPTEAADDYELVEDLIHSGMDTARINCAHDNETVWKRMIANIKQAAEFHKTECRIYMDLAGHKLRTDIILSKKDKVPKKSAKKPRIHLGEWLVLCKKNLSLDACQSMFNVPIKAVFTCTYSNIIERLKVEETVWIDDGKIGTIVQDKSENSVLLKVNQVGPKGVRLKEEKGINFPQTQLDLPTLSQKDIQDLTFVSQYADIVGLSFTEKAEDVLLLQEKLGNLGVNNLPIFAKIETAHAFRELPNIISTSLVHNINLGIMIARGDLATELGGVRMAEVQEEILWLCDAARIPVIWATQVLESLAKEGVISRPEISDAAMAERAECIMLNKGSYTQYAVTMLSEILQRMETHQFKKHSRMRALHW